MTRVKREFISPLVTSTATTSLVGPLNNTRIAGGGRAELGRLGTDANPTQIQTVSIPAGENGHVGRLGQSVAVPLAGGDEPGKFRIGQCEEPVAEVMGQARSTPAVARIFILIEPARVVQKSEELDDGLMRTRDLRKSQAIGPDAGPVRRTVYPLPVQ